MIIREQNETEKKALSAAAFTAWLMGAGKKETFGSYLKKLGLTEKSEPLTAKEKRRLAKEASTKARQIIAADKRNRK